MSKTPYMKLTEEEKRDLRSEMFCDEINKIERRPDGETQALKAIAILQIIAESPVDEDAVNPFPRELAL